MDLINQAQDFLDKAQERMADATTVAAWKANQSVRWRALQKQVTEIEADLERLTLQLGNQTYQMWKKGSSADPASSAQMQDLCQQLDRVLIRYRQVNEDMTSLRNAVYDGTVIAPSVGSLAAVLVLPPHTEPAESLPVQPATPPAAQQPIPTPPPAAQQQPIPAPPLAPSRPITPPRVAASPPAPPVIPPPRAKAKPCPSCGSTVPADAVYCPHCGYMAR